MPWTFADESRSLAAIADALWIVAAISSTSHCTHTVAVSECVICRRLDPSGPRVLLGSCSLDWVKNCKVAIVVDASKRLRASEQNSEWR